MTFDDQKFGDGVTYADRRYDLHDKLLAEGALHRSREPDGGWFDVCTEFAIPPNAHDHPGGGVKKMAEEVVELRSRLIESARLHGMGASREARLLAEVEELKHRVAKLEIDRWEIV